MPLSDAVAVEDARTVKKIWGSECPYCGVNAEQSRGGSPCEHLIADYGSDEGTLVSCCGPWQLPIRRSSIAVD